MLESDYSLALSINLSGIPSQIQRGASRRCLLFRADILPISCTRNERVFLISPCNTYRSCCASPFGTAVALLYNGLFSEKACGRVQIGQPVITHHFFERDSSLGFLKNKTHV